MTNDIRKQRPNYYDDLNFPHGFRRSGLFTILEAEFLRQNGHLMKALYDKLITPETEEESEFVDALQTGGHSEQLSVKVWRKYLRAVADKKSTKIFMSAHSGPNMVRSIGFE